MLIVIPLRFERRTHALEGRCSIQLSYGTILICGAKVVYFFKITNNVFCFLNQPVGLKTKRLRIASGVSEQNTQ